MNAAKHYHQRARETQSLAEGVTHAEARQMLMQIADEYEQWARAAEAEARETSRRVLKFSIHVSASPR